TEEQGRAGFLLGDEGASRQFAGMRQEAYFVEHPTCHYDLEFVFEFTRTHLRGMVCYCRDLFVPSTIETLIQQFESLVTEALARPETPLHQLPWSLSQLPEPPTAVQAETIPRHLAKVDGKFLADARAFACRLLERGVERGHFVPVIFPRGRDAWIAILGLQWIGAIPIPIDADGPAVKLETILADTGFRKIVAEEQPPNWVRECDQPLISLADSQVGVVSELDATGPVPTDAAYVIYTSGSTGQPKGVRVSHAAICNTLAWRRRSVQLSSNDRVLILLSHQFDASMAVVLTTIGQGARPIWYRKDSSGFDLDQLVEQIIEDQITVLPAVPSLLKAVASHRRFEECTSLREIWSGGESITHDLIEKYRETLGCSIWNFYGPTEAAVEATAIHATHCDTSYAVPIGYPIDNVQVLVVDELYRPVPNGVPGQLAIAGAGLADGYQNRSDLTASAFVTLNDGHARRRIYLTGDRGRIRTDGAIEFLGRLDDQVKVNGYRIELDEIDAILQQFPEVARGAVALRNETLVAFVEFDEGIQAKDRSVRLRRFLADKLPTYKRPSRVVFVDRLPLSSSGKVQRSKLASFAIEDAPTNVDRSPLEQYVHEAFVKHLDVDHLSDDENFFEAGGTSLQAAILTSDLSQDLGFSVPSSMLFDLGDVQAVSARLAELHPQAITGRFGDESLIVSRQRRSELRMDSLLADFSREAPDHTSKNHVFMIHPPGGIVICYRELARELRPDRSLVAVRSRGLHGDEPLPLSLAEMAREYVDAIRSRQPEGPYLVGGWSLGGVIAYEVARQICESKAVVDQLILIDSTVPEESDPDSAKVGQEYGLDFSLKQLAAMSPEEQLPFLYEHAERIGVLEDGAPEVVINKFLQDLRRLFSCHVDLCRNYQLETLDVPVTLFRPNEVSGIADARLDRGWGKWVRSVDVHYVSGHHHSMVQAQGAAEMSHQLRRSSLIKGPTQTL
ncbi:MAG: amino acid adenylation domain-containing protein, partial [Planctomycetota bacterium]